MKYVEIICLLMMVGGFCAAQNNVYMKDGKLLGDRKVLVTSCVQGMGEKGVDSAMDKEGVCDCMITSIASHFTYKEFMKLVEKGDFDFTKMMKDKKKSGFAEEVVTCLMSHTNTMKKGDTAQGDFQKEFLKGCIAEAGSKPELKDYDAETYCVCMFNQMKEGGFNLADLSAMKKDLNGPKVQEMVIPCLQKAKKADKPGSTSDVSGPADKEEIHMLALGNIHRVKLGFGKIEKYFTLDSGASDVLIDKELEKELLKSGALQKSEYIGEQVYMIADGSKVKGKNYRINGVKIGNFTVNNVTIGVLDTQKSSMLLCGKSLLSKFSDWKVDNNTSKLILTK